MIQAAPKIVIVDDDPHYLEFMAVQLSRWGYRIAPFTRAQQALDTVRQEPVDLIITDLFMPEFDGIELLVELKRAGLTVPLIGISGNHGSELLKPMKLLGAIAVFEKPLNLTEFKDKVDWILGDPQRASSRHFIS